MSKTTVNNKSKTEKVLIAVIYDQEGKINIDYPEQGIVPIYKLIGFLECVLLNLKGDALDSWKVKDDN